MNRRGFWPDEDEDPPSETALRIRQIARELRAELDPEWAREWNAMVEEVFRTARQGGGKRRES
jgi:hypothetical protein